MKNCLFTNDVETTSLLNGGLRHETGEKVLAEGMPRLLDLYAKYEVKTTFFYIAKFAQRCPEIVKMVQRAGHEVALHGLTHDHNFAFDSMPLEQQIEHLSLGKKILEDISGEEVISFRSPALRVNKDTPQALIECEFKYDSSIAPQRVDMFMSLGSKDKLQWFGAPREPYYTSENNLARRGSSGLIEVPVASFVFPYIGTFMRISPSLTALIRQLLYMETKGSNRKVINFLTHPNEFIDEEDLSIKPQRRARNYISYLLSDVLRRKLKLRHLGHTGLPLLEKEVAFWKRKGYEFIRVKDVNVKLLR